MPTLRRNSAWKAYFQFMGIAIVNPFTIVYFLALIMGGSTNWISSSRDCMMFIVGVTLASLSWQTILAGAGALAQKRLSVRARRATALIGNLIVILMGLDMMLA
jgi:arginine exporter protein ArgO